MAEEIGIRQYIAEAIGVFFIILFGDGYVAIAVLYGQGDGLMLAGFAWAFAVALAIYFGGSMQSGAHYNPGVTLSFALRRGFPWNKVLPYIVFQILGGFLGAAAVWVINAEQLSYQLGQLADGFATPPTVEASGLVTEAGGAVYAQIFAPMAPNWGIAVGQMVQTGVLVAFVAEFLVTAVLMMAIFSLIDPGQPNTGPGWTPWLIGLTVGMLVMIEAPITMTSMNAARDLGPRLWIALMGAGGNAFPGPAGWGNTISTTIICTLGAIAGAYFHDFVMKPAYKEEELPEPTRAEAEAD